MPLYDEHYRGILVTFWGVTEHFSGKNGASRWSILVGKQKHNVQRPTIESPEIKIVECVTLLRDCH